MPNPDLVDFKGCRKGSLERGRRLQDERPTVDQLAAAAGPEALAELFREFLAERGLAAGPATSAPPAVQPLLREKGDIRVLPQRDRRAEDGAGGDRAGNAESGLEPKRRRRRQGSAPKHLTQEQIAALFDAIRKSGARDSVRDLALFRVAYHHGLRASEVGLLQLGDYHQVRGRIYVRRVKGSDSGEYPLVADEAKALRAWLKQRGQAPGPLFPSHRRRGISQQMLDVLMKRYGAAAGIPQELRHFHALKHSCATHLFEMGRELMEVKDWIGHRNVQNTTIYMRVTNRARDRMGAEIKEWR